MPRHTHGFRSSLFPLASSLLLVLTLAACNNQGELATEAFDNGEYEKAMDLWMPLAEDGNAEAQFGIGYLYDKGLGVPRDTAEAIHWYRLSAEKNHALSQLNLGAIHQEGREDFPADPGRAADWYRLAAEQGNASAQYNLGKLYFRGQGLPRKYELAAEWLRKAADQDHVKAINHLGMLYSRGLGVEEDAERGFALVRQAAERGDPAAQLNLATQYIRGIGTEQDFVEALKWHKIFESHEIPGGGLPLDWVDNNMTPADIEEAERRAADWLAEHSAEPKG
jgi:TPR repeat protein